jgi:hypothetical protein
VSTGALTATLNTAAGWVSSVAFSPDGKVVAAGGHLLLGEVGSAVLDLWNVSTGKLIAALPTAATQGVNSVAFSPDGKTLADGGSGSGADGNGGVLELWDVSTGALLSSPTLVSGTQSVNSIAFSPDGQVLFAGTDSYLQTFSTASHDLLGYYDHGTEGGVDGLTVSPNGSRLAYSTGAGWIVVASNPYFTTLSGLSLDPASLVGGTSSTATVTLAGPAPPGGTVVSLISSSPSAMVPASVTIPAGQTSTTAAVSTVPVSSSTTATIRATGAGSSGTASLTILPAVPYALTLSTPMVAGGGSVTGTVWLNGPAAIATVVTLSRTNPVAQVPASVTISADSRSASFRITTTRPGKGTITSQITATLGTASATASLTVTH